MLYRSDMINYLFLKLLFKDTNNIAKLAWLEDYCKVSNVTYTAYEVN